MNPNNWGGARVGTGPKPSKARVIPGGKAGDDPGVTAIPPEDLPAEQRDFWHRYAGLAIEKRTLTVHTVADFRLLCELDAYKTRLRQTIDDDGWTFLKVTIDGSGQEHTEPKAHPLTSAYGRTCKHVEGQLARFGLAPFGKAEIPLVKRTAANPWEQVAQK